MSKAGVEDKPVMDGVSGGEKKSRRAKLGKGSEPTGAKQLNALKPGKENTGEETGAAEKKQKPRKRVKEEERHGEDGAGVGMKRPKLEKTGGNQDGQMTNEKVMEDSREERMREGKPQTASRYERLEAMLDSSRSALIEDTRAVLSEVESRQTKGAPRTRRAEKEEEKNNTRECIPVRSALDKETTKEMKNRPVWKEEQENSSDSDEHPVFRSCSVPEEPSSMCEEEMFFCSLYKCHVTYFGDPVCIDWVFCGDVRNYADLSEDEVFNMLGQPGLEEKLKDAIYMSKQALVLSPQMRLIRFGFWSRYDSDRASSEEDSDVADVLELFSGKSGKYSDDEYLWPEKQKRGLQEGEEKQRRRKKNGCETRGENMNGEKRKKKDERKNRKSLKKMQNGNVGGNSEEGGLKFTKQKADGLTENEEMENKCFTPRFCLPKKVKSALKKDPEKQVQDQTVPQNAMETTPDTSYSKGDMKMEATVEERDGGEDREDQEQKEENQSRQRVQRWEEDFSDEEDKENRYDEDGFLDADMEILGCRRKEPKRLSCGEEEEEQSDFTLMLLDEEPQFISHDRSDIVSQRSDVLSKRSDMVSQRSDMGQSEE
ncbi:hypothetical protein NFI96_004547 [Prochilodus magdalenae]|nr:hypothetical protein NFI96_004547 [Prochilodus magdalenae]